MYSIVIRGESAVQKLALNSVAFKESVIFHLVMVSYEVTSGVEILSVVIHSEPFYIRIVGFCWLEDSSPSRLELNYNGGVVLELFVSLYSAHSSSEYLEPEK